MENRENNTAMVMCVRCNNIVAKDSSFLMRVEDHKSVIICNNCKDIAFVCTICDEWHYAHSYVAYRSPDGICCRNCGEARFGPPCALCSLFLQSNMRCDFCNLTYCPGCLGDHLARGHASVTRGVSNAYKYGVKGKYITINRLVGCEIEAEDGNRTKLLTLIHKTAGVCNDGSLTSGTEVQTPPNSLDLLEEGIFNACAAFKQSGFSVSSRCGLHVHIDARDFKEHQDRIGKLFRFMYAIEPILYAMLSPERGQSRYCMPLANRYQFSDITSRMRDKKVRRQWYKRTTNISRCGKYDLTRYFGLNLHSIFFRGTVEFRHHTGTINPIKILRWCELLLHIINYAATSYNSNAVTRLYRLSSNNSLFKQTVKILGLSPEMTAYMKTRINRHHPSWMQQKRSHSFKPVQKPILSSASVEQLTWRSNELTISRYGNLETRITGVGNVEEQT
jgi:hypothetical protein